MLRTVAAVEQRPWLLLAIVFLSTAFFGFVVQALGNVYLNWRGDPLVHQYRATLSYTSAVIGDGLLIPMVNVFMTGQLAAWRRRPALSEVGLSVLFGGLITGGVHLYQAANDLRNDKRLRNVDARQIEQAEAPEPKCAEHGCDDRAEHHFENR